MAMALALALIVTGTPLASAVRNVLLQPPMRDLTFDYFTDAAGKPKKTAEIEGVTYLCCCHQEGEQEGEQVECQLSDMTTKAVTVGKSGKCKTHLGKGYTSWYNIGKPQGLWKMPGLAKKNKKLEEDAGPVQSCKIPEADVPKATTTTTTTIRTTKTTTVTTTTTTVTTTTTTSTTTTTTTTTARMQIIDMSLNGDVFDAFTVIGYKTFKCCCHSDVTANVEASKEIQCELFNVGSGSEDIASGMSKTGCKQMAAKKYRSGAGWHAVNNMGKKYSKLDYYGVCAVLN